MEQTIRKKHASRNETGAKTVLITGSSTGIGREAAKYFHSKGWNVSATMRTPEKEQELTRLGKVICPALDVTDADSIEAAIEETLAAFGKIDVVVNNAGYGLLGVFEGTSEAQVRRQFETNVFGLMAVVRGILPRFRAQGFGTIVNVASMGGRFTVPLYSVYHASKWAVEGYSESLQFELEPFGILVKIVEPGAIKTDFYDRSSDRVDLKDGLEVYDGFVSTVMKNMMSGAQGGSSPNLVAKTIFEAATDESRKMRFPVGRDARALLALRRLVPDRCFMSLVRRVLVKGFKPPQAKVNRG